MENKELLEAIGGMIDNKLEPINKELREIKLQVTENTQILKSLEHKSDEHKALLDQLNHRTANVEGNLRTINEELIHVELMTGKNISDIAKLKSIK